MTDYKIWLGYLAVAIALSSYVPYFWGIYKGKIKPHAFTWFAWGTLTGIGFAAQLVSGGGAGSWIMAINSLACYGIAFIAFRQGHVQYVLFDWLALTGAFLGIALWWITKNPLTAVILISLSDAIALLPTIRKGYYFPFEESVSPWLIGIIYYFVAFFALESVTLTTVLYPATIIVCDMIFVFEIIIRRKQLQKQNI